MAPETSPKKSCWTCKDRKISCDRATPACTNCTKSGRSCGGYGLRLSWPRPNDRRRAIVGKEPHQRRSRTGSRPDARWVNASSQDVYLYHLASVVGGSLPWRDPLQHIGRPSIPASMPWTASKTNPHEKELLQYFETVVTHGLGMLDTDRSRIRRQLITFALANNTLPSKAVLQAMLALSSLHRNGYQSYAHQMKTSALHTLVTSTKNGLTAVTGVQHIAAGMLLCQYDIQQTAEKTSHWLWYICGMKTLLDAVEDRPKTLLPDCSAMLEWVNYYNILARFSLRHWRAPMETRTPADLSICRSRVTPCPISQMKDYSSYSHKVLRLLSDVCDTLLHPTNPRYHSEQYQAHLIGLKRAFEIAEPIRLEHWVPSSTAIEDVTHVVELFRLAGLVYLERTSRNFSGQSVELDQWTYKAFAIFTTMRICQHPFPLFIFGCEARTDERRILLLDLIERTERLPHVRNVQTVKPLIQSAWVQDDLEVDGHVDYLRKLNVVMSSSDEIPSFV